MNVLIILAVILAGSILESAFAFFLADKPAGQEEPMDALTDARYARLSEEGLDAA